MKPSTITLTDQFCGAGGSSQGARQAAQEMKIGNGLEIKLAMNHWKLAIETHNSNFPDTDHVCTDISACDPRRYPSTNILITSPECTVHSPAGGGQAKKKMYGDQLSLSGKPMWEEAEERSRATMWDVCRFTEYHRYDLIIVENVVEARSKWELFDVWLSAMVRLGYDFEIKYINSMHAHPTPQSRDRMYCIFWKKGNKKPDLNFNPVAPCNQCVKNVEAIQWWKPHVVKEFGHGKYRQQYLYRCPDCSSVVEPYFHAAFNCIDWSKPGERIGDRKKPLAVKTLERCQYGIDKFWDQPQQMNVKYGDTLRPVIISGRYITGISSRVKDSGGPLPVQVTEGRESVLQAPMLIGTNYGKTARKMEKTVYDPLRVQTTFPDNALVMSPTILDKIHGAATAKSSSEELSSQTTGQTKGLMMPVIIKNFGGKMAGKAIPIGKEAGSFTTQDHHGIIQPPVITDMHGTGKAKSAEEALGAIAAGGNHHGLLNMPMIDEVYGQSKPRPATNELGTVKTAQCHGIISDTAFSSFITHYYGGSKVANHIMEAVRTFSTTERASLVTPHEVPYKKPILEDCFYRMLLPHEIQIGMAFEEDYIVLGDSRQKVKQLGNAVTPPVMKFLISRCIETLL